VEHGTTVAAAATAAACSGVRGRGDWRVHGLLSREERSTGDVGGEVRHRLRSVGEGRWVSRSRHV